MILTVLSLAGLVDGGRLRGRDRRLLLRLLLLDSRYRRRTGRQLAEDFSGENNDRYEMDEVIPPRLRSLVRRVRCLTDKTDAWRGCPVSSERLDPIHLRRPALLRSQPKEDQHRLSLIGHVVDV